MHLSSIVIFKEKHKDAHKKIMYKLQITLHLNLEHMKDIQTDTCNLQSSFATHTQTDRQTALV